MKRVLVSLQNRSCFIAKRQQRDNFSFKLLFCVTELGQVSRQSPFSQVELSKLQVKALPAGLQKGP